MKSDKDEASTERASPECDEADSFARFSRVFGKIVAVPKSEIEAEEKKYRRRAGAWRRRRCSKEESNPRGRR